ncbi:hypothetical protein Hdeb2414_s0015g00444331 [Helianthus debilis subsp. tardiflorus]
MTVAGTVPRYRHTPLFHTCVTTPQSHAVVLHLCDHAAITVGVPGKTLNAPPECLLPLYSLASEIAPPSYTTYTPSSLQIPEANRLRSPGPELSLPED